MEMRRLHNLYQYFSNGKFFLREQKITKTFENCQFHDCVIDVSICFWRARNYKRSAGNDKSVVRNFKIGGHVKIMLIKLYWNNKVKIHR